MISKTIMEVMQANMEYVMSCEVKGLRYDSTVLVTKMAPSSFILYCK